jgi:hypothetical protein
MLLVWAGKQYVKQEHKRLVLKKTTVDPLTQYRIDTAIAYLRTGDVVLRKSIGTFSKLLADVNLRDKSYSHCGIAVVEDGYPFIYHAIGGEDEKRPCIRRDSAGRFLSPRVCTAAGIARYSFADTVVEVVKNAIAGYRRRRPVFDTRFSLQSADSLYCSEFVWRIITTATGDTAYIPVSSISQGHFVGTDDLFLNPHANVVWRVNYK